MPKFLPCESWPLRLPCVWRVQRNALHFSKQFSFSKYLRVMWAVRIHLVWLYFPDGEIGAKKGKSTVSNRHSCLVVEQDLPSWPSDSWGNFKTWPQRRVLSSWVTVGDYQSLWAKWKTYSEAQTRSVVLLLRTFVLRPTRQVLLVLRFVRVHKNNVHVYEEYWIGFPERLWVVSNVVPS